MELTRRQLLAALGGSAAAAGGYYVTREINNSCPPSREPYWTVRGERWSRPVRGSSGLLVAENFSTTGGNGHNRVASVQNGEVRWAYTIGGDGGGVPYADDDLVAVGTGSDRVHLFEQPSGHRRWTYDAHGTEEYGGGAWGQPARADGRILVAVSHLPEGGPDSAPAPSNHDAYTHRLLALDEADGEPRWEYTTGDISFVGPVVHENTVVVATEGGGVHGVALDSGERQWYESVPGEVWSTLLHDETRGVVYVVDTSGTVAVFDAATGETNWTRALDSGIGGVSRGESGLFVGTEDGNVVALRESDGETQWTESLAAPVGALDVHGDRVAVVDHSGVVSLLAAQSGHAGARFLATDGGGSRCGWRPELERANGLLYDGYSVTVSAGWWLREFDAETE